MSSTLPPPPTKMRLDIPLLRTKLVLECKDWCPTDIFLEATTARPTTSQEPWIRDEFQERVTRVYPTPPPVEDANDRGNAPGLERARDGRDDTTPAANGLGLRAMQLGGAGWHDNVDRSTEDGGDVKGGLGTGLRGPAAKERYVVMDSLTWQLKKIDTREEAMTLANNPGIDCGNEVWLFLNDRVDRDIKRAINESVRGRLAQIWEENSPSRVSPIFAVEDRKMKEMRENLGVGDDVPEGTIMYLHVYRAVSRIKEHEDHIRKLRLMMEKED